MNYEQDMQIDETALDIEALHQADLMRKYTALQAELQRDEDDAKEKMEYTRAELDKKIRGNPDRFGLEKITESAIFNTIILTDEYKSASKEFIDARFENNIAKGAVRACDQRKVMIETLTKLHGQSYFAGPKVPRDINLEAARKREEKEMDAKIGATLQRRKNK